MDKSLYGRRWELKVQCSDGTFITAENDGFSGKESLKCTFEINYPGYEGWYFSEFNIWNLVPQDYLKIIEQGRRVYFSAGYSDRIKGKYGQIFGGSVFQSFVTRENVTDWKLTLLCIDGERLFTDNFVSFSLNKDYTFGAMANAIASKALSPISMGYITEYLNDKEFPRGCTVLGSPGVGMREVCRSNNAQMYPVADDDKIHIVHFSDDIQGSALEINSDSGLIGTPQQIENGISFRMLLDPTVVLAAPQKWIKLDLSTISVQQQKAVPGQTLVPVLQTTEKEGSPFNGFFKVGGVRHIGDTRGNDWYTDVIGYSLTGKAGLQMTVPTMYPTPDYNGG